MALLAMGCGGEPVAQAKQGSTSGTNAGVPQNVPVTQTPVAPASSGSGAASAGTEEGVYHLSEAQPKLPVVRIFAGADALNAEVCISLRQVATGLMFRESLGPDEAMIFVFKTPRQRAFYMKNVKFPIAAAYIDDEGIIQEIVQLKPMDETAVPSKSEKIQFVLETQPDWFQKRGLGVGTLVMSDLGPLKQALARQAILP